MPRRFSTPTDWVFHAQWLCHRLSVVDGRLHVPKPKEVIELGRTLSSLGASGKGMSPGTVHLQMKGAEQLLSRLGLRRTRWGREPRAKALPMVGMHPLHGLCLVTEAAAATSPWVLETPMGRKTWAHGDASWMFCSVALGWREQLELGGLGLAKRVLLRHRGPFLWLLFLTLWVNAAIGIIAWWLGVEFQQPMTGIDASTLSLLALAGVLSLGLTSTMDVVRRSISARVAEDLDAELARETFARLLKVRTEAHDAHVESLATQVQLFESVRSFAHAALTLVLLDIPFALLFGWLILSMAGPALCGVAVTYVLLKLIQGVRLWSRTQKMHVTDQAVPDPVRLMVMKTMASAETVKSLDLRSVFMQRWGVAMREQLRQNRGVQHLMEVALNGRNGLRQLGFIVWLWVSLRLIDQGSGLTMGAWVGATLLLPRVLYPVASLPALCVQWLQARLALRSIDQIFKLQVDDEVQPNAHRPEIRHGQIILHDLAHAHPRQLDDLRIGHWLIKAGERVGIVGDLGGGKSTLLKLMTGLYKPQRGLVRIDHIDVQDLPRDLISRKVAYLPQSVQLISGTLRDNLLAGLKGVSDAQLLQICQRVGLMAFVNAHDQGLGMPMQEGPNGLSVGQRQLIGLARLLLRDPLIWLLDDPLANLDDGLQERVLGLLRQNIQPHQTLIVVGHQPKLLTLVQRVVVLRAGRLIMDGPRDKVLAQWHTRSTVSPI